MNFRDLLYVHRDETAVSFIMFDGRLSLTWWRRATVAPPTPMPAPSPVVSDEEWVERTLATMVEQIIGDELDDLIVGADNVLCPRCNHTSREIDLYGCPNRAPKGWDFADTSV